MPRTHVVLGRERHTPAQRGHSGGYPMRAVRTREMLYIRNLRPDDWPSGWEAPGERPFRDCDNGPTKTWLLEHRQEHPLAFELCFGKRPAEELYDLASDPWQVHNLAAQPEWQETRAELARLLARELERLEDPRADGSSMLFDSAPYRNE